MRSIAPTALAACTATVALLLSETTLRAQNWQRELPPPQTTVVQAEVMPPAISGRDVPEPPEAMYQGPPKVQTLVPTTGEPGLPQPDSPESVPLPLPPAWGDAPGDFQMYYNEPVRPSGASVSSGLTEPTATIHRDVAFYTGNSFAGLSRDSGKTWTHISPFTRFAALDGGFCCDQRAIHVPGFGMTFWLLEYRYSSSTGRGSLRIAFTLDRDMLREDRWYSFTLNPQTFGFGSGFFLDFSDLSFGDNHLYGSAIVARSSNNTAADLVLWRAQLSDIQNLGGIGLSYYLTGSLGGFGNYRFAQGCTTDMYWAAHESTTKLRVYSWNETSGNASIYSRSVPQWSGSPTPAPGPDSRDWTGFGYTTNTVLAGFRRSSTHIGFMWTSGAIGSHPMNFVRVCRFNPSNNMSLLGTDDIWSQGFAWHFPSAAVNSRGDVGGSICYGGGTLYPSAAVFVIDQYRNFWAPLQAYVLSTGQMGPNSNRWGDYFHAERNSNYPLTFLATGFTRRSNGQSEPRYGWFGREETAPAWVTLSVQSAPTGAPITLEEADRLGRTNGTATFTREYPRNQAYTLTAPNTRSISSATWLFHRWRYRVSPTGSYVSQPIGERVLAVDGIGSADDTAIADYLQMRRLSVTSTNPSSGVSITVTPADFNGRTNGTTTFSRDYYDGENVTLTAPESVGYNPFRHWTVNGIVQRTGRNAYIVMNGTKSAVAVYYQNVAGSAQSIGAGCIGSTGTVPLHTVSWPSGQQGPQQGTPTTYGLRSARSSAGVALNVGLSNRIFGGLRLPLDLTFIGVTGCTLYHDIVSSQGLTTSRLGSAAFPVTWPVDPSAIGTPIFSSFIIIDPGVRRPLPLTLSNAMETRPGGNR